MRPIVLGSNRPPRFYRGGPRIDAFRGEAPAGHDRPEDWVASTTTLFGQPDDGLTTIDGRPLRDLIREDPDAWLGREHVDRHGPDPGLLVKLLAADERLLIHAHPSRAFAERWLSSRWGKTEAWIVLDAGRSGEVWLGWREAMDPSEVRRAVDAQEADGLLQRMNRLRVEPGDAVLVPAGTAHAIGPDMLILEVQEPTDYSILLEWRGFQIDGSRDGHLGLGFDVALEAVDMAAISASRLGDLVRRTRVNIDPFNLLPPDAAPFFRAESVRAENTTMPAGFAVLVVTAGAGQVEGVDDPFSLFFRDELSFFFRRRARGDYAVKCKGFSAVP